MKKLRRFWHWLRNPEYPTFTAEQVLAARAEGYQIGLAQGELIGRQRLSDEIQFMFPPHVAMTADDAVNVKAKQLH
jgi:hypothetical protein